MDKDMKDLMNRLGQAINETMAESQTIQALLKEVEERGFSLTVSLGVMVGMTGEGPARRPPRGAEKREKQPRTGPRHSAFDRKFLKALRIRFTEEQP